MEASAGQPALELKSSDNVPLVTSEQSVDLTQREITERSPTEAVVTITDTSPPVSGQELSHVLTLLEKALIYRRENPEKWRRRQQESERWLLESFGIFEESTFLKEYYRRFDEILVEKKKRKEQQKHERPKLVVQLTYNLPEHIKSSSQSPVGTYESLSATGICVIDKDESFLDKLKSEESEERGEEPEFLIRVAKGKNLLNRLPEKAKKYEDCRLKLTFVQEKKRWDKEKTEYVYVNRNGTTRWDHVFVLKGFTVEELSKSHVIFEVVGQNDDRKDKIGQTILCGVKGKIEVGLLGTGSRGPTTAEAQPWKDALEKPGTSFTSTLEMFGSNEDASSGKTIGSLMRHELGGRKFKGPNRTPILRRSKNKKKE